MGDVVGSIVGTTIEVLLQNLISLCKEEIKLIRNFKKDLLILKESFDMIQAFLNDAEKKQVTDEAVKIWLKNLEAVAFDADNVLDELNYEVLRSKVENGNKLIKKKVRRFFSTRTMARKIREINDKLELINQKATNYGLQRQLRAQAPTVGSNILAEIRETHSHSIDSIVVGREYYVSRIVEIFTSNRATHDEQLAFSILPIAGMGGLGKTTLAKLVFNDGKIKTHYQKLIWVYVSEIFDAKDLFKKILESLTGRKVDLDTTETLLEKLQENLEAIKYLLVLDDIWIEETNNWGDFIDTLSSISSVKGNGIIVTTRSENVASIVGTVPFPKLSKLPDEDCWSIIKAKAFGKEYINPSVFESIGKKIAKRCQGLPLAAKVVGGLLRGKSKEVWISIEETKLSNLGGDGDSIMKILKLSFDNLSSQSLKKCFVFCSIFPKGFKIEKEMLIYLWMAEGFLQSDHGNNMENVGEEYFNLLLQTSLLQDPVQDDNRNIFSCKMHDLVHDLACSILRETGPIRYLYVKDRHISKEEARNLRSLIFVGYISEYMMFSDLKYLRGLVLIGNGNEELPTMEHLIHLRYFNVSKTSVKCLPKTMGNLYHLQTLEASNGLKEMPKVLQKLINLRHLNILDYYGGFYSDESIIREIPMLGHLPHLKSLYFSTMPRVSSIGSSLNEIHNNGIGEDKMIVFPALERLQLFNMSSLIELLQLNREMVAFPRLEYLSLQYCKNLTSIPSYFPCLKELEISSTDTSLLLEHLLVNSTSLTTLSIFDVKGLVSLPDGLFSNNQNLLYLRIECCDNLTHLCPSFGASLRKVEISSCGNLEELPTNLHFLNSLEILNISSCPNLKSIPFNPSGEGRESVQGFTSLRELEISSCSSLTELPGGMIELCTSLEILKLEELPSVTNLAAIIGCLRKMPHLTTLHLDLRNIPKSDNNNNNNNFPTEMGYLRSLHELVICGCRMENWDCVQDQLQHLTTLRSLYLRNLEIEEVPEWLGKLSCLRELVLRNCPKLTKLPSKEAMKWLTKLRISFCPLLDLHLDDDDSERHKISHIADFSRTRSGWRSYYRGGLNSITYL